MALPTLTPSSQASKSILTSTGSTGTFFNQGGTASERIVYPFGIYADDTSPLFDTNFISGASDQVGYTYKMLGGDVLDVELTPGAVYAHYELACLEYSYHINTHQAKNVLANLLGMTTGTFDHEGHSLSTQPHLIYKLECKIMTYNLLFLPQLLKEAQMIQQGTHQSSLAWWKARRSPFVKCFIRHLNHLGDSMDTLVV